jgi:hypothetical protein
VRAICSGFGLTLQLLLNVIKMPPLTLLTNESYSMKKTVELNPDVSLPINVIPGITIRYIVDNPNTQLRQLVLVIDEYTDFKVINDNRIVLSKLFKEMEAAQGVDLNHPIRGNQYGFYQWQMSGMGPKALVSILNYIGLALMRSAFDQKQGKKTMDVYFDKELQAKGLPFLSNASFPEQSFHVISLAAGITTENVVLLINQSHRSFSKNRIPWRIKEGPFNEQKLESRVDYFRKRINQKAITISPVNSELNRLEFTVYWLNKQGYLKKINDMLDKKGGESWKRSNLKIKKRIDQIIENWKTSKNPQIVSLRELSSGIGEKS